MGFFGYISANCPPGCGKESIKWHFIFSSPASKTVNNPVGTSPYDKKIGFDHDYAVLRLQSY